MALQRRVLGFDTRETAEEGNTRPLPQARREELLLRPELDTPCSIDCRIWPSYFLFYPHMHMDSSAWKDLIPACADFGLGLWTNLEDMERTLSRNRRAGVSIAVELLARQETSVREFPSSLLGVTPEPDTLPEGSTLLGYDVADAGFWSGLSNCSYTSEELAELRPQWLKKINDLGLIQLEEDALVFKNLSDKRVPEHAPFWVYRLSLLPKP